MDFIICQELFSDIVGGDPINITEAPYQLALEIFIIPMQTCKYISDFKEKD